ncbi:MAG TPA: metallophosphoesterase [Candidatus Limnocylindrales bacterium]|nr:metallophosphoesterase [Candidatus Limnocylindrales bacterium]
MTPSSQIPKAAADVLYTADLHGSRTLYTEAVALARSLGVHSIILGGDLAPHATVVEQRGFFQEFLIPLFREYREEKDSADLFYIMGNDDWRANLPALLASGIDRFHHIHCAVRPLHGEVWIAGLGSVSLTPFALKDWERWEEGLEGPVRLDGFRSTADGSVHPFDFRGRELEEWIGVDLEAIGRELRPERTPLVCAFHGPPHGTALDLIHGEVHVGSRQVRKFLEERQPLLSLHGHIHESPAVSGKFADRLGSTVCVNPGQRMGSTLHAVWFRFDDLEGSLTHTLLGQAKLDAPAT